MLGVGTHLVRHDAIARKSVVVEQTPSIEPCQPAAVPPFHRTIGVLRVLRPGTSLFEQVAGLQCRLPLAPIPLRPFFRRSAPALRAARRYRGHRASLDLCPPMPLIFRKSRIVLSKWRTAAAVSRPVWKEFVVSMERCPSTRRTTS